MPTYLDVTTWSRRDLFRFFIGYDNPYFNICLRLDVTEVLSWLRRRPKVSVSLANHYFALRVANEVEPFHYRLQGEQVLVHEVINGGTTVLLPDESFTFAYFDYHEDFDEFMTGAQKSVARTIAHPTFEPTPRDNLIYFTTLPWLSFTSFAHARKRGRGDSVPRIAFGKFVKENDRTLMPFSVEVHHALMDGLHVGRYVNRLQEVLDNPEGFLESQKTGV
ncbi:MAG TPA: chloramphenicol acetyltransferase [Pyrinomonadaceae bacterium]|nr:chloramphenicol acetyltransferase [Pyrinomonadaceae bacterium]